MGVPGERVVEGHLPWFAAKASVLNAEACVVSSRSAEPPQVPQVALGPQRTFVRFPTMGASLVRGSQGLLASCQSTEGM